jgi:hypothetical protein
VFEPVEIETIKEVPSGRSTISVTNDRNLPLIVLTTIDDRGTAASIILDARGALMLRAALARKVRFAYAVAQRKETEDG